MVPKTNNLKCSHRTNLRNLCQPKKNQVRSAQAVTWATWRLNLTCYFFWLTSNTNSLGRPETLTSTLKIVIIRSFQVNLNNAQYQDDLTCLFSIFISVYCFIVHYWTYAFPNHFRSSRSADAIWSTFRFLSNIDSSYYPTCDTLKRFPDYFHSGLFLALLQLSGCWDPVLAWDHIFHM